MTAPLWRYLFDTSALVNLMRAGVRVRVLTALADSGALRLPERVAKEIRRRDDNLKSWIERHGDAIIRANNENTAALERITREYRELLGSSRSSADPVLIAMALYYGDQVTVVTDDSGIQAVCFREGIRYLTSQAFWQIERP